MIAYRIQDKSRGVGYLLNPETAEGMEGTCVWSLISYLIDLYDEDYTLTYDQLVEKAEENN